MKQKAKVKRGKFKFHKAMVDYYTNCHKREVKVTGDIYVIQMLDGWIMIDFSKKLVKWG